MSYKEQVEAAIVAAGHAVEWKPYRPPVAGELYPPAAPLRIDGVDSDVQRLAAGDRVAGISGWAARRLHADPAKAAGQLIERHKAQLRNTERSRREQARRDAEEQHEQDIEAHLRPFCHVRVRGSVTLTFDRLTVEQAEKIAAALRSDID